MTTDLYPIGARVIVDTGQRAGVVVGHAVVTERHAGAARLVAAPQHLVSLERGGWLDGRDDPATMFVRVIVAHGSNLRPETIPDDDLN